MGIHDHSYCTLDSYQRGKHRESYEKVFVGIKIVVILVYVNHPLHSRSNGMVAYHQHLLERLQFIPRMKRLARIPMAAKYILRFVYGCFTGRIWTE